MEHEAYFQLRDVLDKLPNGFPATDDGLEIRILKKIFTVEEAGIAARLKMKFETADAIAARTGMEPAYLKKILPVMAGQGQIFQVIIGDATIYKLIPFVFGIYEYQLYRLDRELVELVEEYFKRDFGREFHGHAPSLMKVVPIEAEIPSGTVIEPYESVTRIIESGQSFAVADCICKKEKKMHGEGCDNPMEVCLGIAPLPDFFDNFFWGRTITKDEAFRILRVAEDAGLVHMTSNVREGHIYICNCCGCCCGMLRGLNEMGYHDAVARSNYRAAVDEEACTACGACVDRCQVKSIDLSDAASVNDRCIGCGLCVSACPVGAIAMVRRGEGEIPDVPRDDKEWARLRGESRGRKDYKELL